MKSTPQRSKVSKTAVSAVSPSSIEPGAADASQPVRQIDPQQREALVRLAAYAFYERRGLVDGHELEDWLQAEMEVERQLAAGAGPSQAS